MEALHALHKAGNAPRHDVKLYIANSLVKADFCLYESTRISSQCSRDTIIMLHYVNQKVFLM